MFRKARVTTELSGKRHDAEAAKNNAASLSKQAHEKVAQAFNAFNAAELAVGTQGGGRDSLSSARKIYAEMVTARDAIQGLADYAQKQRDEVSNVSNRKDLSRDQQVATGTQASKNAVDANKSAQTHFNTAQFDTNLAEVKRLCTLAVQQAQKAALDAKAAADKTAADAKVAADAKATADTKAAADQSPAALRQTIADAVTVLTPDTKGLSEADKIRAQIRVAIDSLALHPNAAEDQSVAGKTNCVVQILQIVNPSLLEATHASKVLVIRLLANKLLNPTVVPATPVPLTPPTGTLTGGSLLHALAAAGAAASAASTATNTAAVAANSAPAHTL